MSWSIYLLYSSVLNRTYIGSTTNVARRLRQHNGELVGGARSTKKGAGTWVLLCWISGFQNRSIACRWEKLAKLRGRGRSEREGVLVLISQGVCPPGKKHYPVPEGLTFNSQGGELGVAIETQQRPKADVRKKPKPVREKKAVRTKSARSV